MSYSKYCLGNGDDDGGGDGPLLELPQEMEAVSKSAAQTMAALNNVCVISWTWTQR